MPEKQIRKQGGAERWRTIVLPHHKGYIHVAITKKKGPHGGRTVAGEVHHYKDRGK
jgi:hypothetical protein